jgi:hypothetical protein
METFKPVVNIQASGKLDDHITGWTVVDGAKYVLDARFADPHGAPTLLRLLVAPEGCRHMIELKDVTVVGIVRRQVDGNDWQGHMTVTGSYTDADLDQARVRTNLMQELNAWMYAFLTECYKKGMNPLPLLRKLHPGIWEFERLAPSSSRCLVYYRSTPASNRIRAWEGDASALSSDAELED